jgi:hypothetical protein
MKPIKFITTFSQNGYTLYGKHWIKTFSENVENDNVTVDLYLDFLIPISDSRINIVNYDSAIPNHKNWIKQFESKSKHTLYNKKMGIRFSFKSFVMQHAIDNNKDCYVVWLDGDCIYKPNTYNFIQSLLNGNAVACQREHNGGADHIESGIVIFDVDHLDTKLFNTRFKQLYQVDTLINQEFPYDGFMIYLSLKQSGITYTDLNAGYGRGGIQSDPNQTFLHPEIQSRFYHNIGPSGKARYDSWEIINKTDEYFKLLKGKLKKSPEEIKAIRQKLIDTRAQPK